MKTHAQLDSITRMLWYLTVDASADSLDHETPTALHSRPLSLYQRDAAVRPDPQEMCLSQNRTHVRPDAALLEPQNDPASIPVVRMWPVNNFSGADFCDELNNVAQASLHPGSFAITRKQEKVRAVRYLVTDHPLILAVAVDATTVLFNSEFSAAIVRMIATRQWDQFLCAKEEPADA